MPAFGRKQSVADWRQYVVHGWSFGVCCSGNGGDMGMNSDFDYIIVGAGSAGCVLAARLSEDPNVKVALLEAGPPDRSVLIHCPAGLALMAKNGQANWAFDTVPQPGLNGRRAYQPCGKVLGGSSSINAMIYIRGQRSDYDDWAAQGNRRLGLGRCAAVLQARRAQRAGRRRVSRRRRSTERDGPAQPQPGSPRRSCRRPSRRAIGTTGTSTARDQEGFGMYQVTHRNGERFSAAKAYLAPNLGRPNLRVITDAQTTRILMEGRRATGVEYRQAGQLKQLKAAREVLLSAGAHNSPKILMLSGIGPGDAAAGARCRRRARPAGRGPESARPSGRDPGGRMRRSSRTCSASRLAPLRRWSGASSNGAVPAAAGSPPTSRKRAASSGAAPMCPCRTCNCISSSAS